MTKTVTAAQAKTHLSDCLREVEQGKQVVITRYGRPVAVLVGPEELKRLKRRGSVSSDDGLAGLVGRYSDGPELAKELDVLVAQRSAGRDLDVPDPLSE